MSGTRSRSRGGKAQQSGVDQSDTEIRGEGGGHIDTLYDEHIDDDMADLTPSVLQQPSTPGSKAKQKQSSKQQPSSSASSTTAYQPSIKALQEIDHLLHKNNTTLDHLSSRSELLPRIKGISNLLKDVQELKSKKIPNGLKELSEQLTSKTFMKLISSISTAASSSSSSGSSSKSSSSSQSENIELLAYLGCICADLFRIYAPNPPFDGMVLRNTFRYIFIPCMYELQNINSPLYTRHYYILETMSQIKGWLVLTSDPSYINECILLFDTFYQLINHTDISTKIEYWIIDGMSSMIQEYDHIPMEIIDTVLLHLNPHINTSRRNNNSNMADDTHRRHTGSEELSIKLINRCENLLQRPINMLLSDVFIKPHLYDETSKSYGAHRSSHERFITDHASEFVRNTSFDIQVHILYDLLAYCPSIITPIQLQIEDLLEAEDKDERLAYVNMFGRLLTRTDISYAKGNDRIIHEYIARFNDKEPSIRLVMADVSADLLMIYEKHRPFICTWVVKLMNMRREDVRLRCVESIITVCKENIGCVTDDALIGVGERLLDHKKSIRILAAEGLAILFNKYAAPAWRLSKPLSAEGKRIAWIPRRFTLATVLSTEMTLFVDTLFDELFLGKKTDLQGRISCLIGMFVGISGNEARGAFFSKLLYPKQQMQILVRQLLECHTQIRIAANEEQKDKLQHRRATFIYQLAKYFIIDEAEGSEKDYHDILLGIIESRYGRYGNCLSQRYSDKNMQKYLQILSNPTSEYAIIRSAASEFQKAVARSGSASSSSASSNNNKKLSKEKVARRLAITLSLTILPRDALVEYFEYVKVQLDMNRHLVYRSALELLLGYADLFPENFYGSYEQLHDLCQRRDEASNFAIQILSHVKPTREHLIPPRVYPILLNLLRDLALTGTPLHSKFAIKSIHQLYGDNATTASSSSSSSSESSSTSTSTGDDTASKSIREILQKYIQSLNLDNEKLATVMSGLSQIARYYPHMFEGYREVILPFISRDVLPQQGIEATESRTLAISTLVEFARTYEETHDARTLQIGQSTLRILLRFIQNDGRLSALSNNSGNDESSQLSSDRESMLKAAAIGSVDMMSCNIYRKMLIAPPRDAHALHPHSDKNPQQHEHRQHTYHPYLLASVALLGEHPSADVRTHYADRLCDSLGLKKGKIPLYYSPMLVFIGALSSDPKTLVKLKQFVKLGRERARAEKNAISEAMHENDENNIHDDNRKKSVDPHSKPSQLSQFLPEVWLMDFIYLLSYHPDIDDTMFKHPSEKYEVYDLACKYIEYFMDALCDTVELGSNFGLTSQVLGAIKQYEDVRNPARLTIYKLVDLAGLCLRHRISVAAKSTTRKQTWDLSSTVNYGKILPPAAMYQRRADGTYVRTLIPQGYIPPRQKKDEENKHKRNNPEHHAAHELLSPSKKRKGSVTSVESSSHQTSPSHRTSAKKEKKTTEARVAESESESEESQIKTPMRDIPSRRAKKGAKSYQDVVSDDEAADSDINMSTIHERDVEALPSDEEMKDAYANGDADKENVESDPQSNQRASRNGAPRSSSSKKQSGSES